MVEIAICDDQKACINDVYHHVKKILAMKNIDVHYTPFLSGLALLESDIAFDIVFLDIEMPGMDGIEVGKRLRLKNENCKIIMVTSLKERYKDAFHFQAFRYVTKPIMPEEIEEAISSAVIIPLGNDEIELFLNRAPYKFRQKDIKYVRAYNGYTEFAVGKDIYRREESLVTILQNLDSRLFYQISRQHVINLKEVKGTDKNSVTVGSDKLKVSTRAKKDFEKVLREFDVNYSTL